MYTGIENKGIRKEALSNFNRWKEKIKINSTYGATISNSFEMYSELDAAEVIKKGQEVLKKLTI